jgi:hypothetical protein
MMIWHMCISGWVPKAINTLGICNIYCFFTAKMVARMRLNVALNLHCLSCSAQLPLLELSDIMRRHGTECTDKQ